MTMPAIDINSWMASLLDRLLSTRQRQLVVLQGPRSWCDERVEKLFASDNSMLVLSNRKLVETAVSFGAADSCLGSESRVVVLDLFEGFNPDVLCIAAGLVQSGGVLVTLSPPVEDWDLRTDRYACWQDQSWSPRARFAEYFFAELEADAEIGILLTPGYEGGPISPLPVLTPTPIERGMTAEQDRCLQRIEQWLASGQAGVALINADRGRGKSTCLGLLLRHLQPGLRILVTANSRKTTAQLLQLVPDAEFVAPDRLLLSCPVADLVIIDEAAMLPQSMLRQLHRLYPRLVMATTSGGYEGTGRGFMLRFVAQIEAAGLIQLELEMPVRWCQGDRLEAWLNRTLILDSEPLIESPPKEQLESCELLLLENPWDAEHLPLLKQVYRLMHAAHYRSRPSDLRMLMENPDLVLIVARSAELVVGAVLLNIEGGLDEALCEEIFLGRRRPRGHLLAQMLTAQAGIRNFAKYRGVRIQRIAVAETCRRQGLGTRLLERARLFGQQNAFAYLGASFALDPASAGFWQQAQFSLVHVSYGRGKSSGEHSIAVLHPLEQALDADMQQMQQRIQQQLPIWMTQFLQTMDATQVVALLRFAGFDATLNQLEQREIEAFARGNKGFELCFVSLQKYVMRCIARSCDDPGALLIEKAIQNRNWELLERESGAEGRKQLQKRLRGQVEALCKDC
jgi:tRNA(Met) cytidine acetyltransferase